jgi:hypothetical protein
VCGRIGIGGNSSLNLPGAEYRHLELSDLANNNSLTSRRGRGLGPAAWPDLMVCLPFSLERLCERQTIRSGGRATAKLAGGKKELRNLPTPARGALVVGVPGDW